MGELDSFNGDGKGRVLVSAELGSNVAFGYSAKAFVSFGVSCDSSMEAMGQVHDLLVPRVQGLVEQDHIAISDARDELLPPSEEQHALRLGAGSKSASPSVPEKVAKPPVRKIGGKGPSKSKKPPAPAKPRFRR